MGRHGLAQGVGLLGGDAQRAAQGLKARQALGGGLGVAVAAMAGGAVARAGLRPVARLTEAAERVARTDDLRPIPVFGSDELARLTEAFNMNGYLSPNVIFVTLEVRCDRPSKARRRFS